MRIQYLNGGLANQTFQYIFYRHAELTTGLNDWYLDDSFFYFKNEHNGYELEKVFGVKPKLLSSIFTASEWEELISERMKGISVAQSFQDSGYQTIMVAEDISYKNKNSFNGQVYSIPCNQYQPIILDLPDEVVYYHGYWINKNWLNQYKSIIVSELQFPDYDTKQNLIYSESIYNSNSVGIHIRRGDFVSLNWQLDVNYYAKAISQICDKVENAELFIFSDDLAWCFQNKEALNLSKAKNYTLIEGNTFANSFYDLKLLSECKHMIMSNSSFCYLAALLNNNLQNYINPVPYREL